ncbi:MAG TPA: tannase/feruloyl esterase family alpha/beta hydrolase [Burkholderiaceae bacterium]|nr:tannase/feruloyl esterase family alpha/beta hydrolase [Burkholderiaceae bacterium]
MDRGAFCAGALALATIALQGCGGGGSSPAAQMDTGAQSAQLARGGSGGAALAQSCESLAASLAFPNTVFTSSTSVAAGVLKTGGQDIAAHCRLVGKMHERVSSVDGKTYAIGFEMRLPLDWNGRFFYQANGGIDGNVVTATGNTSGGGPLTSALLLGFAVISSDAGHNAAQNPTFGLDPQARLDYGYQSVGKVTPMAKSVIHAAYGKPPVYSYIGGCSNGGRHTMVAAARYPDEYDGYLIGAPGFNLPQAAVANIYGAQQYAPFAVPGATIPAGPFAGLPDLSGAFTQTERQLLSNKVLERCDALDGLADGLVQDVRACQRAFDIQRDVPTCPRPRDGSCLSAGQKIAIGNIFAGARDSQGRPIYSSFPYDGGHASPGTAFWEFTVPLALDSGSVGFVFSTPPADLATFNPVQFVLNSSIDDLAAAIFATNDIYKESGMSFMTPPNPTQLQGVQRRGGRMVVYHGVSDAIFSIDDTTRWFRRLNLPEGHPLHDDDSVHSERDDHRSGPARSFARLFHVPSMNHCSGGPSTDQFDLLTPLVQWVEQGQPPERVIASARGAGNPGGANPEVPAGWAPNRTRPLCAYPSVAVYKGGDVEKAESFVCR